VLLDAQARIRRAPAADSDAGLTALCGLLDRLLAQLRAAAAAAAADAEPGPARAAPAAAVGVDCLRE
jgi:hypothetical protein